MKRQKGIGMDEVNVPDEEQLMSLMSEEQRKAYREAMTLKQAEMAIDDATEGN